MLRAFDTALPSAIGTSVQNSVCQPCTALFASVDACSKLKTRICAEFQVEVRSSLLQLLFLLRGIATNLVRATLRKMHHYTHKHLEFIMLCLLLWLSAAIGLFPVFKQCGQL